MSYLFKKGFDVNFSDYLWNIRMKKAEELLSETGYEYRSDQHPGRLPEYVEFPKKIQTGNRFDTIAVPEQTLVLEDGVFGFFTVPDGWI